MKKATTKKKIVAKKASVSKKAAVSKKAPVKKLAAKKKPYFFKLIGIFIAVGGVLGLVILLSIGLTNLLAPTVNEGPVLGATTAVTVNAPSSVKAVAVSDGIKITWKNTNVAGNNYSYIVYRKTGLMGSRLQIAHVLSTATVYSQSGSGYVLGAPTTFTDTNVSKNKLYTYYVVASTYFGHMVEEPAGKTSRLSSGAVIWSKANGSRTGVFNVSSLTPRSITIDGKIAETGATYYRARVMSVADKSYDWTYTFAYSRNLMGMNLDAFAPNYDKLFIHKAGRVSIMKELQELEPGKQYSVEISLIKVTGFSNMNGDPWQGNIYQTILSKKILTTPDSPIAPAAPTGFKYVRVQPNQYGTKSALFSIDLPQSPVDGSYYGYMFTASCLGTAGTWGNNGAFPKLYQVSNTELNFLMDDWSTVSGDCTVKIKAYNDGIDKERVFGPETSYTFSQ